MRLTPELIKDKKKQQLVKTIHKGIQAKMKEISLGKEEFDWLKQELQWPSHVTEFVYEGVIIKKL